ncbi:MAG TPA: hypothetical protein VFO70_03085 [Chitinophagaceae bacterium]|nr:hypothetical protein [Chitinophagaceae bacterium]
MIEKDIARSRVAHDFLLGGGVMGELIRKYDWSGTSLGSPDSWPKSLKTTISILLNSSYPMFVWWGKELVNIYNDAYSLILGSKHPQALVEPAHKVWSEISR